MILRLGRRRGEGWRGRIDTEVGCAGVVVEFSRL